MELTNKGIITSLTYNYIYIHICTYTVCVCGNSVMVLLSSMRPQGMKRNKRVTCQCLNSAVEPLLIAKRTPKKKNISEKCCKTKTCGKHRPISGVTPKKRQPVPEVSTGRDPNASSLQSSWKSLMSLMLRLGFSQNSRSRLGPVPELPALARGAGTGREWFAGLGRGRLPVLEPPP